MAGSGQIPLSAIREYARDYRMNDRELDALKRVIMAVDNRRMILMNKRQKKAAERKAGAHRQ